MANAVSNYFSEVVISSCFTENATLLIMGFEKKKAIIATITPIIVAMFANTIVGVSQLLHILTSFYTTFLNEIGTSQNLSDGES